MNAFCMLEMHKIPKFKVYFCQNYKAYWQNCENLTINQLQIATSKLTENEEIILENLHMSQFFHAPE